MKVIRPGMLTTIQDLGRNGFQKYGFSVGGAMDPVALRIANLIVGNPEEEATLEITMQGPILEFQEDTWIAICGAHFSVTLNEHRIENERLIFVQAGSVLQFGPLLSGCRAYLAVAGGFEVPRVMGSKSTYLQAGIGGFSGRSLRADDMLAIGAVKRDDDFARDGVLQKTNSAGYFSFPWFIRSGFFSGYSSIQTVRVIRGREYARFQSDSQEQFFSLDFQITTQSNRMGYRLRGPQMLLRSPYEMLSTAVTIGTVQVPPDGNPIILMADRQTIGGYPKIAEVIRADLPLLAQLKPGDRIRFQEVSIEMAHQLLRAQERKIERIKTSLRLAKRDC
ncbi:biotin-dependent carboxyltransferase family protein [Sulfoacidibacillus thermotolerans]|uniref:KipI antagonist n=1 Tax=Sulfoacidibacillus thermotolerans TaxID=1765684 RepID=A0A2U3DAU4_SULT2|nr:biotin-dependent carboxyltransferase family protein [Sulfoacidibacillus thermotolerans]PWI58406.1 KipI antagonist [Sulfoacidibacillus thermotolerans]